MATDWVSPRLDIRFVLTQEQLEIYDRQGNRFLTTLELSERASLAEQAAETEQQRANLAEQTAEAERQRASLAEQENERLRELLRQAGIMGEGQG